MQDSPCFPSTRVRTPGSIVTLRHAILLCAALLSAACHDGGPAKANLAGAVLLQDSWANRFTDFSGVRVSLDENAATTFTDKTGAWHIDKVPAGAHSITFAKSAFGTVHIARQFVAAPNTMTPDVIMALTPSQQAIIDSIGVDTVMAPTGGTDLLYIVHGHFSFPQPDSAKAVSTVVFLGKTTDVSPDTTTFERSNIYTDVTGKLPRFFVLFGDADIRKAFGTATHAFATAYVAGAGCTCTPDPVKLGAAKPLFTGTGPRGNVVELKIP
ncbi:MAG TPA: hypothetical protein VLN49_20545 [Gemmatimonadaceae bacterium]|nr:hypothetical protein [Gemmatimonadaceae bacterium]